MNPQSNILTIFFFFFLVSSYTLNCQKESLRNLEIEFAPEDVPYGILNKLENYFEGINSYDEETIEYEDELDLLEYDEEYSEEDYYSEEDSEGETEAHYELEEQLANLIETNQVEDRQEDPMNKHYKKLVDKLCLFTAISKETTVYVTESLKF